MEQNKPEKITLSSETERAIILAQLTENSSMLLSFEDIAQMTGYKPSHIQKNISKSPSFPKEVAFGEQGKNKRYLAGDIVRWIKRHRLH